MVVIDEIISELSHEALDRIDALARARNLTREAMIVELVKSGLPIAEARLAGEKDGEPSGNS